MQSRKERDIFQSECAQPVESGLFTRSSENETARPAGHVNDGFTQAQWDECESSDAAHSRISMALAAVLSPYLDAELTGAPLHASVLHSLLT